MAAQGGASSPSASHTTSPQSFQLRDDPDQRAVIEAAADRFLLVTAPPGAGKTAVACARIAHLARQGVPPASILMISFTRVAVAEFRDRVERMANDVPDIRGVEITTLDAHAWRILKGLAEDKQIEDLFGSYDANIATTAEKISAGDPAITEWLHHFQHIIIDEAQDLIGSRAALVAAILKFRAPGAGATVFADEAQAIYGFTSEADDDEDETAESFFEVLESQGLQPQRLELRTIHRTNNPGLRSLFLEGRKPLIDRVAEPKAAYSGARSKIVELADDDIGAFDSMVEGLRGTERLVLFRTRAQVLMASSLLHHKHKIAHRIRMSGLPQAIEPWVGFLLGDFTEPMLTEDEFCKRWEATAGHPCLTQHGRNAAEAWLILQQLALSRRGVDMRKLRTVLSRSRAPVEVAVPDIGIGGPILGTIHASKGREAADVVLMLPRETNSAKHNTDHREEGRVLYVGATRAKESLTTGDSFACHSSKTEIGRTYHLAKGHPQVEIGLEDDLDHASHVSRSTHANADECHRMQKWLAEHAGSEVDVGAFCVGSGDWKYRLTVDATRSIGCLSLQVNDDMFEIAKAQRLGRVRPPDYLKHLWCAGATTICLHPDSPQLDELHEPHSRSGLYLAPVIRGFTMVYFGQIRQQRIER